MEKERNKQTKNGNSKMSPEKYIVKNGRALDFYECLINEGWEENGMATITVSKQMAGGNFIIGFYLLDYFCLGVKNTSYKFNLNKHEYDEFIEMLYSRNGPAVRHDTAFVHNLIFGALDYAEELGFPPNKDFKITEYLLNPDLISDEIDDLEFGKDGKPLFIQGPSDNAAKILGILNKTVGEGNYDFIAANDMGMFM